MPSHTNLDSLQLGNNKKPLEFIFISTKVINKELLFVIETCEYNEKTMENNYGESVTKDIKSFTKLMTKLKKEGWTILP